MRWEMLYERRGFGSCHDAAVLRVFRAVPCLHGGRRSAQHDSLLADCAGDAEQQ